MTIKAWGGGGGGGYDNYSYTQNVGGGGGFVQATLAVSAGESLTINVGCAADTAPNVMGSATIVGGKGEAAGRDSSGTGWKGRGGGGASRVG